MNQEREVDVALHVHARSLSFSFSIRSRVQAWRHRQHNSDVPPHPPQRPWGEEREKKIVTNGNRSKIRKMEKSASVPMIAKTLPTTVSCESLAMTPLPFRPPLHADQRQAPSAASTLLRVWGRALQSATDTQRCTGRRGCRSQAK